MTTPHWQHGYRAHGYWYDELTRFGLVYLGPRNLTERPLVYGWRVEVPGFPSVSGRLARLHHAKKQVEMLVAGMLALVTPDELAAAIEHKRKSWQ